MTLLNQLLELLDESPDPTKREVYRAARDYVHAGLSLLPIKADGTKMPAFNLLPREWSDDEGRYRRKWSGFKEKPPTGDQLRQWFLESEGEHGFAILGGKVSGGLEIIDSDNWATAECWAERVERRNPTLLRRLVLVQSPRPGLHAYYRCSEFGGNRKLTRIPDPEKEYLKPKAIIEIKGEAGYCLAPPSPAACHKTGRCYTLLSRRGLTEIPTISPEERNLLINCAEELDSWLPPDPPERPRRVSEYNGPLRPGDDFNRRARWEDILKPHGWSWAGRGSDGSDLWLRPDKYEGVSATTNYHGCDLLYVFSTNAEPFEECQAYSKFHAYALLQHDGDFQAAARTLSERGYGSYRACANNKSKFAHYASYRPTSPRIRNGMTGNP